MMPTETHHVVVFSEQLESLPGILQHTKKRSTEMNGKFIPQSLGDEKNTLTQVNNHE